jgi:hypothetical protein
MYVLLSRLITYFQKNWTLYQLITFNKTVWILSWKIKVNHGNWQTMFHAAQCQPNMRSKRLLKINCSSAVPFINKILRACTSSKKLFESECTWFHSACLLGSPSFLFMLILYAWLPATLWVPVPHFVSWSRQTSTCITSEASTHVCSNW